MFREVASNRCEALYRAFCDHASHCSICKQAEPTPENCDETHLCGIGRQMRSNWDTAERNFAALYKDVEPKAAS